MKISRQDAVKLIRSQGHKVFSVQFVKKDGSLRDMNCRLKVKSHWKTEDGSGRKYDPADYKLICVFDMQKEEYRSVNVETLRQVKAGGQVYTVED